MAASCALSLLMLGCFGEIVSSLECYECFSYESEADCQSMYKLKLRTCASEDQDVCMRVAMNVSIVQKMGEQYQRNWVPGFARYCGKKFECNQNDACRFPWKTQHAVYIKDCKPLCCSANLQDKCHARPYWPGGDLPSYGGNSSDTQSPQAGARAGSYSLTQAYHGPLVIAVTLVSYIVLLGSPLGNL
ncbi:uncharacterized protein LOC5504113 isoform X2 [Nematostella vectensis]|uniref:uncharacterized protein LOC5504113 isoform X2 n=1 Tax=Nematostella vectensis TaxID=45351 RepID=UPI00138FA354|nr:uncharacterized protein LOC5504113 isoform X2 [Nematostella vectensis]